MQTPPTPDDEAERVAALEALHVLDSPPEERFDRYTRLARRLFDVPIVLVSLVDTNRQWFKSRQGLDATETPRDISFCGHSILSEEVFVVEDASEDDRFCDNPLVTGDPNIRFYAGYPLPGPRGHRMGTLCIIDRKPRTLDAEGVEALRDIGTLVANELGAIELATMHELTGLWNRRGFERMARHALSRCERTRDGAAALMIDMDGFKAINDQFGHGQGDRALVEFAAMLRAAFRESDVVARLGGDEFCVLLTDASGDAARAGLARLRRSVAQRNRQTDREYLLAFSVGVADRAPHDGEDLACVLRRADAEMYQAKQDKRDRHKAA